MIIPLIGGSALGSRLATGTKPLFHLSYSEFSKNEAHLRKYMPGVDYINLSKSPELPEEFTREIDFVTTICPCAGLSMLNTSKGNKSRGSNAAQNDWMYCTAEFVLSKIKPKCFWGENAPMLYSAGGTDVRNRLREIGARFKYSFSVVKTSTILHGVPQDRRRTFYFFWRSQCVPLLRWKKRSSCNLVDYLAQIPANASAQDMFMTEGKASERFKPYKFILEREGLSHREFAAKIGKSTVTEYLLNNDLVEECICWLNKHCPSEGFYTKRSKPSRTFIQFLRHVQNKLEQGLGYWDESPRFVGFKFWPALIRKSMMNAVHPTEDRYLNVREMMHLMGLPMDFEIESAASINHIAQNVPVHTARDFAEEVVTFCRGQAEMSDFTYLKADNINQRLDVREAGPIVSADKRRSRRMDLNSQDEKCVQDPLPAKRCKIKHPLMMKVDR